MSGKHGPLNERLWRKVSIGGPDDCWPWTGASVPAGYGHINNGKGKMVYCHRLSFEIANGPIAQGMKVLHRCDNPPCVNPAHLFLGTHDDNMRDMFSKGRNPNKKGENQGISKLTADKVRAIRADTRKNVEIARTHGVAPNTISQIKSGLRWAHV